MANSETSSTCRASPPAPHPWLRALRKLTGAIHSARRSPSDFLAFAFTDTEGRPLKQGRIHGELQAFLSAHSKALIELPRDHGKTLQMCGRVIWELGRNPSLRVKVVCANEVLAAQRSRFLRDAIARNSGVRVVFPALLPAEPWKPGAFTIARPADTVGPSVAAFGIGCGSTGARADLLICDDVCDVKSLDSDAARQKARDYFHNNLMNLLEPNGRFWGFSTPWHADDLNSHLKRSGAYALFRRAVGPDLEPVWPEKWSRDQLAARRAEIGEAEFGRAFRLVTISDGERLIRPEWIQFWDGELGRAAFEQLVVAVDPAVSRNARADASALVVLGKRAGEIRVLAALARRLSAPELVECIDGLDRDWRPDVIVFESNAAFAGIRDLLQRHARFGPRLIGVPQSQSKAARVQAFSVPVQNGTVRLKGEGGFVGHGQRELFDEMITFPRGAHDDLVDAAAMGTAYLMSTREPRIWV